MRRLAILAMLLACGVAHAQRVIAAFGDGDIGAVQLDGKMLDRPHLVQAERTLAAHEAAKARANQ